jgi:hypothetical protein
MSTTNKKRKRKKKMNLKTFLNKHLSKRIKAECNRLGERYRKLEAKDEETGSDFFHGSDEPSEIRDRIINMMAPSVKRYAKNLFNNPADKDEDSFEFFDSLGNDQLEVFCVRRGKKGWVASVSTNYWDAPADTCDDSTCVPTPAEAFEWGFGDAMAYHFINEKVGR